MARKSYKDKQTSEHITNIITESISYEAHIKNVTKVKGKVVQKRYHSNKL